MNTIGIHISLKINYVDGSLLCLYDGGRALEAPTVAAAATIPMTIFWRGLNISDDCRRLMMMVIDDTRVIGDVGDCGIKRRLFVGPRPWRNRQDDLGIARKLTIVDGGLMLMMIEGKSQVPLR